MSMPFTTEQFFELFGRYNTAVWPMQVALIGLALAIIALVVHGKPGNGRWVSLLLAMLWAWMAIAYHFTFFTAINPAAWAFGAVCLVGALWLGWVGVARQRLRFDLRNDTRSWIAGVLVAFALLLYPVWGWLAGHRYPAMPTFGLPCPTTIFTISILLLARGDVPRSIFVVPILWSAVGSMAAFSLGVHQDLGLLVAGLIGIAAAAHWGPFATAPTATKAHGAS